jgi:ribonuclease P protein component
MKENSLSKYEKLKGIKPVKALFNKHMVATVYPIKAVYAFEKSDRLEIKIGFSVAKRKVNKAHERNRIKRVLRESFRQCKKDLYVDNINIMMVSIMFIFLDGKPIKHLVIQQNMKELVKKINKNIEREN